MPLNPMYERQVRLLLRVLPSVAEETCFALKGGTAINLFIRDMPRLSVDIDLTYVPIAPWEQSLAAIDTAMHRISARIGKLLPSAQIVPSVMQPDQKIVKLLVRYESAQVKIEVTPVLRGCVYEPTRRAVSASVENSFGFAEMQVVSFADLYAGKIVAALDRQHPRDLFDVRDLLAKEGIDNALRCAFIVYLISHNRPMHELLAPVRKPLQDEFLRGFEGMTHSSVIVHDLELAREALITSMVGGMPDAHRRFLLSFEQGDPDWTLLDIQGVSALPAVQWRRQNLNKLNTADLTELLKKLEAVLSPST